MTPRRFLVSAADSARMETRKEYPFFSSQCFSTTMKDGDTPCAEDMAKDRRCGSHSAEEYHFRKPRKKRIQ